jgi:hypothetical protein
MEKFKHTPGNWIEKDGQIYPEETGKTLALIPYFDKENKEHQANAELIAAAPKMLERLNKTLKQLRHILDNDADLYPLTSEFLEDEVLEIERLIDSIEYHDSV